MSDDLEKCPQCKRATLEYVVTHVQCPNCYHFEHYYGGSQRDTPEAPQDEQADDFDDPVLSQKDSA